MSIPVKSAGTGNVYLGNKIVAECWCWEDYYIDLTNSSSQAVIDAWWLLAWNPAFWSDWMYRVSWDFAYIYKTIDFSKWNSVKIITNFYLRMWWWYCSVCFWIIDTTSKHIRSSRHETYWSYSSYRAIMFDYNWDNPIAKSSNQMNSTWWYKEIWEFNPKTWYTTCELEWTWHSLSYTLSAEQLSTVLQTSQVWWIVHCYDYHKIKDIEIILW